MLSDDACSLLAPGADVACAGEGRLRSGLEVVAEVANETRLLRDGGDDEWWRRQGRGCTTFPGFRSRLSLMRRGEDNEGDVVDEDGKGAADELELPLLARCRNCAAGVS